jgi:transposase-like protein
MKRTGNMSATAREFGVSVNTIRDRLISYRIKMARAHGVEMGTVAENRLGRVGRAGCGRPTNAEREARAAAINSNIMETV